MKRNHTEIRTVTYIVNNNENRLDNSSMKNISKEMKFSRNERIKKPDEIKRLFKEGKKVSIFGAKLFYLENDFGFNRIAFPLPRGYGNAIKRNLSKRYSRESYRKIKSHLNNGFDMLMLVYPSENDSFSTRCEQFQTLCKKAGLMVPESSDLTHEEIC